MKSQTLCRVVAVALFVLASAGTAFADPKGLWRAQDGAIVRVSACGNALCGRIVTAKSPTDPSTGMPWTDKNNMDSKLRSRPLVGIEVFISMKPDGPGKWTGDLYSVDNGAILPGHIMEIDQTTIRIEGCAGSLCGGQNMTRAQ